MIHLLPALESIIPSSAILFLICLISDLSCSRKKRNARAYDRVFYKFGRYCSFGATSNAATCECFYFHYNLLVCHSERCFAPLHVYCHLYWLAVVLLEFCRSLYSTTELRSLIFCVCKNMTFELYSRQWLVDPSSSLVGTYEHLQYFFPKHITNANVVSLWPPLRKLPQQVLRLTKSSLHHVDRYVTIEFWNKSTKYHKF